MRRLLGMTTKSISASFIVTDRLNRTHSSSLNQISDSLIQIRLKEVLVSRSLKQCLGSSCLTILWIMRCTATVIFTTCGRVTIQPPISNWYSTSRWWRRFIHWEASSSTKSFQFFRTFIRMMKREILTGILLRRGWQTIGQSVLWEPLLTS